MLLAASTRYPHQAFRLGDRRLGAAVPHRVRHRDDRRLGRRDAAQLAELGYDADERWSPASTRCMADVEEVWQPFAARFAALALGELARRGDAVAGAA